MGACADSSHRALRNLSGIWQYGYTKGCRHLAQAPRNLNFNGPLPI